MKSEPEKKRDNFPILCFLLSTASMLFKEFGGRVNLGEGALKTEGIDVERLLVIKEFSKEARQHLKSLARKYPNTGINSIFSDLNARSDEDLSLSKVKPDRRELDKIIMGEILGLTDEEQVEVYRAVIDLVKSRIEKSKSVGKNKKIVEGVNITALKNSVIQKIVKEPQE